MMVVWWRKNGWRQASFFDLLQAMEFASLIGSGRIDWHHSGFRYHVQRRQPGVPEKRSFSEVKGYEGNMAVFLPGTTSS